MQTNMRGIMTEEPSRLSFRACRVTLRRASLILADADFLEGEKHYSFCRRQETHRDLAGARHGGILPTQTAGVQNKQRGDPVAEQQRTPT